MESSRMDGPSASHSALQGRVEGVNGGQEEIELRHVLEIAQAPTRGRTCGFGDADRRALSAPLIARLRVFSKADNKEIPVDDIDISFLVVAADLWSANGTEDMNLVQHPSAHYAKAQSPSAYEGYRPMSSYEDRHRFSYGILPASQSRPSSSGIYRPEGMPTRSVAYGPAGHRYSPAKPEHTRYREANQAYPVTSHGQQQVGPEFESGIETSFGSPPVNTFAFQAPRQSSPGLYHQLPNEADLDRYPTASTSYYAEQPSTSTSTVSSSGLRPATMSTRRPSTGATSIAVHAANEVSAAHKLEVEVACVKNLIGAVTTNGHKLKAPGEAGLGIFFVFHDLSVRTEGTFTIRLRLVSIGRQPSGMYTGTQPVLSECLTPPFEVMSAKKFPGMLDPTPMSQAFAKQGLRIPTRKGANRKRRRQDGAEGRGKQSPTPEDDEDDPYS